MRYWILSTLAFAVVVLATTACQPRPRPAMPAVTGLSLPEINNRAQWRQILGWGDDCQQAFDATHAGTGAGVETLALDEDRMLVAVLCAAGAYQSSFEYFLLNEDIASTAKAVQLQFPTFEAPDGRSLVPAQQTELWGEPEFLAGSGELTILSAARQTRDCGTWARYGFIGQRVELREFWARFPCPAEIQPPADPKPGSAPADWRRIR